MSGFLHNASSVQPLVLVLEDLHWADRGTLDLLTHMARNLAGARLLIIATYRDVEVDRAHPLSATLAELRRVGELPRVPLRGLTPDEVHRMLNTISGQEIHWGLAEAVHRQTEGNPLFVQEVLRYLVEEGLIVRKEGRWEARWREDQTAPMPEMSIPEGLRDVIGKRLSKLSPQCNRLLSVAAVIGREFRLDVLERVIGVAEDELFSGIREATGTAILEERGTVASVVTYRFSHAFFRQTLYEEMIAPERIRLHQQVARTLEQVHSGRLDEHAVELAEHFSYYSDPTDLAKSVTYGEMAARRAMSVFAYQEAAGHLGRCLRVQEVLDPGDQARRLDLLLDLGEALMPAGEPQRVFEEVAEEAFDLAENLGDGPRASRTCRIALLALNRYAAGAAPVIAAPSRTWADRADRHAATGTVDRVYADTTLAILRVWTLEGRELAVRSLELARQLEDNQAYFFAARPLSTFAGAPKYHGERLQLIQEVLQRSRQGVSARNLAGILHGCAVVFLGAGDRRKADELWREIDELGDRTRDPTVNVYTLLREVLLAYVDGDLEGAAEKHAQLIPRATEMGSPGIARAIGDQFGFRALVHLGRFDEAQAVFETWDRSPLADAFFLATLGRKAEAEAALSGALARGVLEETPATFLLMGLEAAVLLGDPAAAEAILPTLAPVAGVALVHQQCPAAPGRVLGAAAAFLERPEEARAYYQQGLAVCEQAGFRPEVALIRLGLAELLLGCYPDERADALDHLDFAIAEFRAMKMAPSLDRALALQASLVR